MAYPRFQRARAHKFVDRRAGGVSAVTSTTWTNWDTTSDIQLDAAVGDDIVISANGIWNNEASTAVLDVATWVSGAGVHWFGPGEPTTTTGGGISAWSQFNGSTYGTISGLMTLTLVAGDLSGNQVTLRLRTRLASGTTKLLYNSSVNPFQWMAWNVGPVDPT